MSRFKSLVALTALCATSAGAAEVYYGRLTAQSLGVNAQLIVVGTQAGVTAWTYTPLPAGAPINGTVNQFQRVVVFTNTLAAGLNFRLDTSQPVLATAGMDCCDFSGNVFFPTVDGKRFYGTQHVVAPAFSATVAGRITVFSRLASTVTITNLRNSVVATNVMPANAVWAPAFEGAGSLLFQPNDIFRVSTVGEVAIAQVVGNGYAAIPPLPTGAPSPEDCDNDSGASFLFGTHNWRTGSVAVMNSSASTVNFTIRPVTAAGPGLPITPFSVLPNAIFFQAGLGLANYRLDVTTAGAKVDVWAGDNEGVGNTIDTMGDDLSLNLGTNGLRFLLRSSNVGTEPGLVIFSREANTAVTLTPRPATVGCVASGPTILGVNGILSDTTIPALTKGCTWQITSTKPITVWSFGGISLNDSASSLRPAMAFDTDGNGIPDVTEAGSCTATGIAPDFDGDSVPDYADFDDDDDCVLDTAEPVGGRLSAALPAGAHCAGSTPFCDTAVHAANGSVNCRACASNAECAAATPVCVVGGGAPFQGTCIVAPDTTITASPAPLTNSTSATFNFTGTPAGVTFQCSLDGAAFSPCAGPLGFTVTAGAHNFQVRSVAGSVVDATPASFSWTVDNTAPLAPIVTAPANGSSTNAPTPTYSGTAEPNSTVRVRVDGVAAPVCTVVASAAGNWTCSPAAPVLAAGAHTVNATATDAASNLSPTSATNTFTVDFSAPLAPVVQIPANGSSTNLATPTYSGTAEPLSTVRVFVDGAALPACTVVTSAAGGWACSPAAPVLLAGIHTVNATATDPASNPSAVSSTNTFTVDLSAPLAPVVGAPANGSSTNVTTPTYSGTAEAFSIVQVRVDGVVAPVCTVVANAAGNWTCSPAGPVLLAGSHTVNATATDAANNVSPTSATNTFTVDLTPPLAPVVTAPANGSSTNVTTPTYSGTAEALSTVRVRVDGVAAPVCTVVASAAGSWTCSPAAPVLLAGSHTVNATATDPANNLSPTSATNTFTVDLTAPAAPVMNFPSDGSFTNNTTPTYSGTAEPGSSVTVSVDGAAVCVAITSGAGFFSCAQPVALAIGAHSVNAISRDAASNASPVSNTNGFTVDTTAPVAPVVTSPANGSTTNNPTPTYSGTAEGNSTVAVVVDGSLACVAIAGATGAWSCTPAITLADGSHAVSATARDAANNLSPPSVTNTFTVDTGLPAAPVVIGPANSAVTSNNFPTYSGTAEAGTTVTVRVDGVVVCTAIATGGGTFSCAQATALLQGVHLVNATATDAANNTSPVSNTNSFTVDTTAPAVPVVTAPAANGVTGNLPTYSGTAEPGSTITVSVDGAIVCTALASATGAWACVQPTVLADGPHTVNATAKDTANNTSGPSATISFGVDTTPPNTAIVSGPLAQDPSSSATFDFSSTEAGASFECSLDGAAFAPCSDPSTFSMLAVGMHTLQVRAKDAAGNIDATPAQQTWEVLLQLDTTIVSGPAAVTKNPTAVFDFSSNTANVTYECSIDGAAFAPCTDPASITGLPDGPHSLRVRAKDALGNIDTTPALHLWLLDTLPPGAPLVTSPTNSSTLGITPPTITGTAEPGTTITVIVDGVAVGTALVNAAGTWTFTPPMPLPDGMHTVLASATDPAGNTGPSSAPIVFTIDSTALDTSIVSGPTGITSNKTAVFDFASNKPGVTYECSLDGGAFAPCSDPAMFSNLAEGPHTLLVRAKDPMGNIDASPASRVWKVDSIVPGAPVVTSPANNATVGTATPTVTGTAEPGSTVAVVIDGVLAGTAVVDANGSWSFVLTTPLGMGPHTVAASATDPAGNVGPSSPTHNFTVDTTLLDTFIVSGPMAISRFSTAAFDLASNLPNVSYECALDGGLFVPCADPVTFTGLSEGNHTVLVRAKDALGNVDLTPASFTWKVDTVSPAAPLVTTPADQATLIDNRPTVTGTAEPGSTVSVSIDNQFIGWAVADASGNWSLPISSALIDGAHTVNAVATDAVGNKGPVSATNMFTIVTSVLAAPTITEPANATLTNDSTPTLRGKAPPNSTVSVFVDGVLAGTVVADANGDWTFTLPIQPDGSHSVTAQATKGPQKSAVSAPTAITIDATPPDVRILASPPAQNLDATASFEFGSADPTATYECSLDGGPFEPCSARHSRQALRLGEHTLSVRAVDAAGNRSSARSVTWSQAEPILPPRQLLAGGGCGCSVVDPTAVFALLGLLALARRRLRLR